MPSSYFRQYSYFAGQESCFYGLGLPSEVTKVDIRECNAKPRKSFEHRPVRFCELVPLFCPLFCVGLREIDELLAIRKNSDDGILKSSCAV